MTAPAPTSPPSPTLDRWDRPPLPPAPSARPQLTERGALALAASAGAGALAARPVPVALLLVAVAVVVGIRRPAVAIIGVAVLASGLAARSYAGLAPTPVGPVAGVVTLVADPTPTAFGWRADVRLAGRRFQLEASEAAGGALSAALAGERVRVEGRTRPPRAGSGWLIPRHVVGHLDADVVERVDAGSAPWRAANRFRRLLVGGAAGMDEVPRSLYAGFVLGDDRDQRPEVVDDFEGAGLTHLLVVSGQNVAFVLVLVSPLTRRVGWRWRWAITIGVIGAFATVTRFEPSVLRASAMAAVAITAGAAGRPTGSVRTLALAVTALLLVDPLLVRSVGFQLSVGATLAIATLAVPIAARLPGPRLLAETLGVTLAAQVGVAPILVPLVGGLPVASVLANPVAVPIAGLVTTWGLPAGVLAGIGGPAVAAVAHAPTEVMIRWVAMVARIGASLPLGSVTWPHLIALGTAAWLGGRSPPWRRVAPVVAVLAICAPALALRSPPELARPSPGVAVHRAGGATVVVADARPADVLAGLRAAGVQRVDVLVAAGPAAASLPALLRHRWTVRTVIDASAGRSARLRVGDLVVSVAPPEPPSVQRVPP